MNALILGGTGSIGHNLVQLLVMDKRFEKIELLSRRELDIRDVNVINHLVDFSDLQELPIYEKIDILFITFGTTLKKAGTQEKQNEIDIDIPTNIMKLAREIGIDRCVIISAFGVSLNSPFAYSRMKAQLDENAKKIGFSQLILIKPSMTVGPLIEKTTTEKLSILVSDAIGKTGLIDKIKPVESISVAKCMIQSIFDLPDGTNEISSDKIEEYAKKYTDDSINRVKLNK